MSAVSRAIGRDARRNHRSIDRAEDDPAQPLPLPLLLLPRLTTRVATHLGRRARGDGLAEPLGLGTARHGLDGLQAGEFNSL